MWEKLIENLHGIHFTIEDLAVKIRDTIDNDCPSHHLKVNENDDDMQCDRDCTRCWGREYKEGI